MHRPGPADLLRGVHAELERSVLPALEDGAAQRQLKASLHILRRLERCWERMPAYLAEDNADLEQTLARLDTRAPHELAADPGTRNEQLQRLLIELDARADGTTRAELARLYRRMLDREAWAWGTA